MLCLRSSARVDLVGLLKSQSAVKFVDTKFGLRAIAEFCVMDGSKLEGLTAEANFSLFLPATVSGEVPSALVNLQKAVDSQKPLALMGLYAKVDKGEKPEVSTSVDFHWFAAEGPKAMALEQAAQELLALQEDSKANVTAKHSYEGRDYSGVEFRQATVALLEASASASNTATQFLQVNFATIAAPMAGASLETQDGARLWITTCMRDCTGSVAIALTEKAILGLTAVESKAVFMNSYTADTIQFPMLASVRVVMEDGNAIVVEAAEQDYSLQPTLAMRELTVFGRHDDGIVCSALASLGSSIHHRVMVGDKPVDRALVLLCSTGKSVQEQIGPNGFRIKTCGVRCGSNSGDEVMYEIVGTSTTNNLRDYILDAPKTGDKRLYALALVMSVRQGPGHVLMVDQVQQVGASDVSMVQSLFAKLVAFGDCLERRGVKRNGDSPVSPATTRTCRRLSQCPTDKSLDLETVKKGLFK